MIKNTKAISAQIRADRDKFYASDKPAKTCKISKKRVSALSAYEDKQMMKELGLL